MVDGSTVAELSVAGVHIPIHCLRRDTTSQPLVSEHEPTPGLKPSHSGVPHRPGPGPSRRLVLSQWFSGA